MASLRLVPPCSVTTLRGTTTTLCGKSASLVPVLSIAAACSSGAVEVAFPPGPLACAATAAPDGAAVAAVRAPARRRILAAARFGLGADTTISGIGAVAPAPDAAGAADGVLGGAGDVPG